MVFDGFGDSIKGLLGGDENPEPQEDQNIVDEEFSEMYSDELIGALENRNYRKAEDLAKGIEMEFGELMDSYIGDRITSASTALDEYNEMVGDAKKAINKTAREISKVKNKENRMGPEKIAAKPSLGMADGYISQLNSDEGTEVMREAFRAFHMAAHAADYVESRDDVDLNEYDTQKVKVVAGKKADEIRNLDEEMGLDFLVPEYNKLVREYNNL